MSATDTNQAGDEGVTDRRVLASFIHSFTTDETPVPHWEELSEAEREKYLDIADLAAWYYDSNEEGDSLDETQIRRVLSRVEREAATHGADYAAGMRHARHLVERQLYDELRRTGDEDEENEGDDS